jgi:catechol 2,3-dioxygenase-like lactoylglutathione lyase family enzyme
MDCRIGYVTVGVRDLERSLAFYRDVLGFSLMYSAPEFRYASCDVGGIRFAIAAAADDSFTRRHTGIGLMVEDVDAAHAELSGKGVEFTMPPGKQPWGGYMGIFADPDGNTFYLDSAR